MHVEKWFPNAIPIVGHAMPRHLGVRTRHQGDPAGHQDGRTWLGWPKSKKKNCLKIENKKNLGVPRMYLEGLQKTPCQFELLCDLQKIVYEYNDLEPFSGTLCSGHIWPYCTMGGKALQPPWVT